MLCPPDRPGLRNSDLVQKINRKLETLLQKSVSANHGENAGVLLNELKKKIPDLRTLNALHSDKLLAYKMEPQNLVASSTSANGEPSTMSGVVNRSVCQYASTIQDRWQQFALMGNGQASPAGSDWGDNKDSHESINYGSPRSVSSSESASIKSPPRSASVSSAKSNGYMNGISVPEAHSPANYSNGHSSSISDRCPVTGHTNKRPIINSNKATVSSSSSSTGSPTSSQEAGHSSGDEGAFYSGEGTSKTSATSANGAAFSKIRRVDSPTDSGIESGKEHGNTSTPTTSVCSSPRSALDEKVKDVSDSEGSERQETIDDMPMLKRALQAPPLINTNMLMDEAYRHHKKFRNSKRESTSPAPSTAVTSATSPSASLASSHSTLVKTLEQAPRFLNEQQMKRTDLIHNIIMRTEAVPSSTSSTPAPPMDRHPQFPLQQQALGKGVLVGPHGYYIPAPFNNSVNNGYSARNHGSSPCSSSSYPQSLSPRVIYPGQQSNSSGDGQDCHQLGGILPAALQRRSPMVSPNSSSSSLVMGSSHHSKSAAPSPSQLHHHLTSPQHHHHHHLMTSRSPSSSPVIMTSPSSSSSSSAAIKLTSDSISDSQPLNLSMSKRVSTNTPTVKMESS